MATSDHRDDRSPRRAPTLADALARRLARLGLMWATRWILAALALVIAIALFAAWGLLAIAMTWIGGLFGWTTGSRATPFVIGALVVSGLLLFLPTRWAARNLLRAERTLDATVDRLAIPTALDPGTLVERRPMTPAELSALDARLAPTPAAAPSSGATQGAADEPDRR